MDWAQRLQGHEAVHRYCGQYKGQRNDQNGFHGLGIEIDGLPKRMVSSSYQGFAAKEVLHEMCDGHYLKTDCTTVFNLFVNILRLIFVI